jgi:hypothetical protein
MTLYRPTLSSEDVKATSYLQDKGSNLSSFLRRGMFSVQWTLLQHAVDNAREIGCELLRSEQEQFDCAAFVVVTYENASSFQKSNDGFIFTYIFV